MKKKLTLAIAAYVLLVAGILTYIYCPRTVIKNTAMWYEKDFTIPIFCKTVEFKQLYDLGLYNGKFEVSKDQAEKIIKQLDDAVERYEMSKKQSYSKLTYKEIEIKENTTDVRNRTNLITEKDSVISKLCSSFCSTFSTVP